MGQEASIIDHIYEAAIMGQRWPEVLGRISSVTRAEGATLFTLRGHEFRWAACDGLRPVMQSYIEEGWIERSTRHLPLVEARHAGFLADHQRFTSEQMAELPVYRDFLHPRGIGVAAATIFDSPQGDILMVNVERRRETGPFDGADIDWLDSLRPHLLRAALISSQLGLERAATAARTLELIGLPAAVLSRSGDVRAVNDLFEALTPEVFAHRARGVALQDRDANAKLAGVLTSMRDADRPGASIPVPGPEAGSGFVLHLVPVRREAQDVFSEALCLLIVNVVGRRAVLPQEMFRVLLDLTPAEADVARRLSAGESPAEIAIGRGVSVETVRAQIKSMMQKTGRNRVTDLVALFTLQLSVEMD